jgi:hypothetical protein
MPVRRLVNQIWLIWARAPILGVRYLRRAAQSLSGAMSEVKGGDRGLSTKLAKRSAGHLRRMTSRPASSGEL